MALRSKERHYFAKSIVNRLWSRYYGRGLVMPLDQMHPENAPSHPDLLDWLAADFVKHKYDLRRLIRGLVLSETYARSSRWQATDQAPPDPEVCCGRGQAANADAVRHGLEIGSTNPDQFSKLKDDEDKLKQHIERFENSAQGLASWFEQPGEDFQISVTEALLMSNAERARKDLLRDDNSSLIGKLKAITNDREAAQLAVWTIHGRQATTRNCKCWRDTSSSDKTDDCPPCDKWCGPCCRAARTDLLLAVTSVLVNVSDSATSETTDNRGRL